MAMKKGKGSVGTAVAVGAGVAAIAAAGYFFFGPNGTKNRKAMKGWMIKMKGEIVEKLEKAKEVSEPVYHQIVDTVSKKYASVVDQAEVDAMTKELKKHWKAISGQKAKKKVAKKVAPKKAVSKKK